MQDWLRRQWRRLSAAFRRSMVAEGRSKFLLTFFLAGILAFALFRMFAAPPTSTWVSEHRDQAASIPLTAARQVLKTNSAPKSRAAVDGDHIYIEVPSAKGLPDPIQQTLGSRAKSGSDIYLKAKLPYYSTSIVADLVSVSKMDITILSTGGEPSLIASILRPLISTALLILALLVVLRLMSGSKVLGVDSGYQIVKPSEMNEGFEAVAGIDTARDDIVEIVSFLTNIEGMSRLGGRMPRGLLLKGPPGTGKTLLARAMAKEANISFIMLEANAINQLWAGMGSRKIKKIFSLARRSAPCIVFIDEIDAIGNKRGGDSSAVSQDRDNTLNTLLVEMDGFEPSAGVFVIAATNRREVLDSALTRSGRIDREISIDLPTISGREAILRIHCRDLTLADDVDFKRLASSTYGFSGADLAGLANEAALVATRRQADAVYYDDFGKARDRFLTGHSGSARELSEDDRWLTAVHEAGHALIACLTPEADPVEKVTILPQGAAMGFVMQAPNRDVLVQTKTALVSRIRIATAGRAAEKAVFGEHKVTSGAASDIRLATNIARAMVYEYGMSDRGFVAIDTQDPGFLDQQNPASAEIRKIINDAMSWVEEKIASREDDLKALAFKLVDMETIDGDEVKRLVGTSK